MGSSCTGTVTTITVAIILCNGLVNTFLLNLDTLMTFINDIDHCLIVTGDVAGVEDDLHLVTELHPHHRHHPDAVVHALGQVHIQKPNILSHSCTQSHITILINTVEIYILKKMLLYGADLKYHQLKIISFQQHA